MRPPGARMPRIGAARRCSGPSRMLAKTRSNGARARMAGVVTPFACMNVMRGGAVEAGIIARDAHGRGVDVGRDDTAPQARAAAMARTPVPVPTSRMRRGMPRPANVIEREETAARRAVMAGAEGERRLDLDADTIWRHARRDHARRGRRSGRRRPASVRPGSRRTQSLAATVSKRSAFAASEPAAIAVKSRRAASSGSFRKNMVTRHRPRSEDAPARYPQG